MFQDATTVPVSLAATDTADNAKYYHSKLHADWRDEQEPHFKLHFLPPYGPELNPIERVWKLTRRSCLHNQSFSRLELAARPKFERLSAVRQAGLAD